MGSNISGDGYAASDMIAYDQAQTAVGGVTPPMALFLEGRRRQGDDWATAVAALLAAIGPTKLEPTAAALAAWKPEIERRVAASWSPVSW